MRRWLTDPLLKVEHLTMRFGGLTAVDDVSFDVGREDITALIGPNGAGKTTVFNCITGFYKPTEGTLKLDQPLGASYRLERLDDHDINAEARVARTFQNIRLFGGMTVLENLMVAQHRLLTQASRFPLAAILGLGSFNRAEKHAVEYAKHWLDRVGLTARADVAAAELPYGEQRKLEIARALCTRPLLLCLDEPAAGLNARESESLNELLRIRAKDGIALLLIEHDMSVVMRISDHIVVLDYGKVIADGTPEEIRNNPQVIAAYLGVPDEELIQVAKEVAGRACSGGGHVGAIGVLPVLHDVQPRHSPARDRGADRCQWRRQDHADDDHLRPPAPEPREDPVRSNITELPAHAIARLGIAQSPEGRRIFPRMTVMENLRDGLDHRRGRRDLRPGPRPGLHALSGVEGEARSARRHAFRRRAADARHRPRADGTAEASAAG